MAATMPSNERVDSPSSHASEESNENPFMALVDAAASLLEAKTPKSPKAIQVKTSSATGHEKKVEAPAEPIAEIIKGTKEDLVIDGYKKQSFAEHLMAVLDDEANNEVLSWMPDGKAFTIANHKKFTMDYMPKLFKIRNMSSFVRKLCRWGFQRVHEKDTGNSDIFKHPFFIQGTPALVRKVKCVGRVPVSSTATPTTVGATTLATTNTPTGSSTVTPNSLPRQIRQPESRFVYESMPSPESRERQVLPPSMQLQQQHQRQQHQQQHQHHQHQQQVSPASPPRNMHHFTQSRNQQMIFNNSNHNNNNHNSNSNIMNQHSMSNMDHRRMYNLQGHHSSNLHNVHSQVVSAALETLQRDNSARSYRNGNGNNNNGNNHGNNNSNNYVDLSNNNVNVSNNNINVNNNHHRVLPQDFARRVTMNVNAGNGNGNTNGNGNVNLSPSCLRATSRDFLRRVTMPHKAVPFVNLSYNDNNNNNSRQRMPVLLEQVQYHPNVGGSGSGNGIGIGLGGSDRGTNRRNIGGSGSGSGVGLGGSDRGTNRRSVSWGTLPSLSADSGRPPFLR
jgi:hypothetical protein